MTVRTYCSVEDRKAGEPMPGMGQHPARNLLIRWPIARWSENLRRARDMTPEELDAVEATVASGWRVNLIDRPGEPADQHRVYQFPEQRAYTVPRRDMATFLNTFAAAGNLSPWAESPTPPQVVLCCTHGRKDKCCARFGNMAWRALVAAQQAHNLPVDIWRCTHLGGCRFSASAIVFPQRHKYGRIEPEQALPLLQAELAGRAWAPNFRGSSNLSPAQQCAEVNAMAWLDARGYRAELSVGQAANADPGSDTASTSATVTRVVIDWQDAQQGKGGQLEVTCHSDTMLRYSTCKDIPKGKAEGAYWAVDNIRLL